MVDNFVFDVDGTLTPSRRPIDKEFGDWFLNFSKTHNVFLVTGSDRDKTIEQIGEEIYNTAKRVYNCSGNDVWEANINVYTSEWKLPTEAEAWLRTRCKMSEFPLRTGLHIEDRPGMINFSVVGRNATLGERKMYVEYDTNAKERTWIANAFKAKFSDIEAVVGGDTGIDIYPVGHDKSQILRDFDIDNDFIYFFGDKMDFGGNDWPLKMKFVTEKWSGNTRAVEGWQDTWRQLEEVISEHQCI
tara:strand:- start:208 stop:939 length:732 start_codon:yes stop_codon:yes gene_type:complete